MVIYTKVNKNLFGEQVKDIFDKDWNLLVSLGNDHVDKMIKEGLEPSNDKHIVMFLKYQYPDMFPSNTRVLIKNK